MDMLRVGDKVLWSGAWGSQPAKTAKVKCIEVDCVDKEGTPVQEVPWFKVKDRSVVVNLDREHWAYGFQISPMRKEIVRG